MAESMYQMKFKGLYAFFQSYDFTYSIYARNLPPFFLLQKLMANLGKLDVCVHSVYDFVLIYHLIIKY